MKKGILRLAMILLAMSIIAYSSMILYFMDPSASIYMEDLRTFKGLKFSDLQKSFGDTGKFKSTISAKVFIESEKADLYYGQKLIIENNPIIDKIYAGISQNERIRIELWKCSELIEYKEWSFHTKMNEEEDVNISISMRDERANRDQSEISLRVYQGSGFFGDIGSCTLDLSGYGSLSSTDRIEIFERKIDCLMLTEKAMFSNLRIWKDFNSKD